MEDKRCKFCNVLITRDMLAFRSGEEVWCIECNVQKIKQPDQQPNDVEVVDYDKLENDLLSNISIKNNGQETVVSFKGGSVKALISKTIDQLQEKIAELEKEKNLYFYSHKRLKAEYTDTEAKLKQAVELLGREEKIDNIEDEEDMATLYYKYITDKDNFLDTIRKETP